MKYVLDDGFDVGFGCFCVCVYVGNNLLNYSKTQLPGYFSECLPGILLTMLRSSEEGHYQIIKTKKLMDV